MNDDEAREVLRGMLEETRAENDETMVHPRLEPGESALTRALELFDERMPTTAAELRAEAGRLAREVDAGWEILAKGVGQKFVAQAGEIVDECWFSDVSVYAHDEPTALRALVAALREIARGNAG